MSDITSIDDSERILADCLEDYHRRRALGENPQPTDYAGPAGTRLDELRSIVATEERVDIALGESQDRLVGFPRPFGEYSLLRELGRGAMGIVYESIQRRLGRTVALKVLRTGLGTEPVALERFRREAKACAHVRHPNIVEVYDAGEVDGEPFYSMAIVEGRPLRTLTDDDIQTNLTQLLRGFASIADALAALHKTGIIHRDIKPSNILIADDDSMILSDFGIARTAQSERMTVTGQALGTPLYMSPEQLLGQAAEIDGRADVYGLGAAMYEVFVGRKLFEYDDIAVAVPKILNEQPQRPRSIRRDLPAELESILLKCLEKQKEDRYQDAASLRDDLLNLAEGRKVVGRPVSRVERGLRNLRRFAPLLAVAALAVAVGVYGWTHREATVIVDCWPRAQVAINGETLGETSVTASIPPGRHELTLTQIGFAPRTETFEVGAGERLTLRQVLVAASHDDPDAAARIVQELDEALAALEPLSSSRTSEVPPLTLVFPRGIVRAQDLDLWRVDVSEDFQGPGRIEFRRGAELLFDAAFDPTMSVNEQELPIEVRSALAPGDTVTWSVVPQSGATQTAQFTLTDVDLTARLDEVATRLTEQPPALVAGVQAQVLLDAVLPQAAYRVARQLLDKNPQHRHAALVAQHALHQLELSDTQSWRDICQALDSTQ